MLALAALLFVALVHDHWQFVADDAFIAFRYARNLAAGHGPVWNPGEAVEGFSSPLWLGLLALGCRLGAALPAWSGALGVLFLAFSLMLVHRTSLRLGAGRLAAALACAAVALLVPLYHWAAAGLETTLFAALVTAAVLALVAGPAGWAVVGALLGIARPEGPFLLGALLVLVVVAHGRSALTWQRIAVAVLPTLAWFIFRRLYYGDWLPNTYYAKATGALWHRLEVGFLYASWALLAWAAAAAAAWLAGMLDRRVGAALGFLAVVLALVVGEGGDWMWYGRLLAPVLPGLCAVAAAAIAGARAQRKAVALVACLLAFVPFTANPSLLAEALTWQRRPAWSAQEGTLAQASAGVADFIRKHYPADALVAVNHAGALPYALANPALDMTGLCDWHIAHDQPGGVHQKFDAAYVLSRSPDLVVLNSATRPGTGGIWYHPGYWEGETALVEAAGWEAYQPVDVFWEWRWVADMPRYIVLFERKTPSAAKPAGPASPAGSP